MTRCAASRCRTRTTGRRPAAVRDDLRASPPPKLRRGRMVSQFARQISRAGPHPPARTRPTWCGSWRSTLRSLGLDGADDGRTARARPALTRTARRADRPGRGPGGRLGGGQADHHRVRLLRPRGRAAPDATAPPSSRPRRWRPRWRPPPGTCSGSPRSYGPEGEAVLESLRGAARVDQRTSGLEDALAEARVAIVAVIDRSEAPVAPKTPAHPGPPSDTAPSHHTERGRPRTRTPATRPCPDSHPLPGGKTAAGRPRRSGGGRTTAARALAELQRRTGRVGGRRSPTRRSRSAGGSWNERSEPRHRRMRHEQ